jgi:hypothetical protein
MKLDLECASAYAFFVKDEEFHQKLSEFCSARIEKNALLMDRGAFEFQMFNFLCLITHFV